MPEKQILSYPLFDGTRVYEAATVVLEGGIFTAETRLGTGEPTSGGFLMPGLIDGHTHLDGKKPMEALVRHGVTTTCAVGVSKKTADLSQGLKIHTSRTMALGNVTDGAAYVRREVAAGADYIKVILESPPRMAPKTMDSKVLRDIVRCAHDQGLKVAAHTVCLSMTQMAVEAGVDILIHVPMTEAFPRSLAEEIAGRGMAIVPTLSMMEAFAHDLRFPRYKPEHYPNAQGAVGLLHSLGVPVLAGTDASDVPFVPKVRHGSALHHELALLVKAGLTPIEALQGATGRLAAVFGLPGGVIAPGRPADLVLVEGRPDRDISQTAKIRQIWVDGTPVL